MSRGLCKQHLSKSHFFKASASGQITWAGKIFLETYSILSIRRYYTFVKGILIAIPPRSPVLVRYRPQSTSLPISQYTKFTISRHDKKHARHESKHAWREILLIIGNPSFPVSLGGWIPPERMCRAVFRSPSQRRFLRRPSWIALLVVVYLCAIVFSVNR